MKAALTKQPGPGLDGRRARKLRAMRRVQEAALTLFEDQGFDAVTIEQIAKAADVSPPTVYRGFGTKEQLVLWDEYDPMLLRAIEARLPSRSVRKSVLEALTANLDEVYSADRARILRRAKLMLKEPALMAASTVALAQLKGALATTFVARCVWKSPFKADVAAAAIVATFECAVGHWVRTNGRVPLGPVLRKAFAHLGAF